MERKCTQLRKSGCECKKGDPELVLSREALFFFSFKGGEKQEHVCLLAE